MVEIDWKTFLAVNPEKMTEREKDDLYDSVTWYIPSVDIDRKYLVHFVRVVQEILKYKAEQVDLLTNELDDLAAKQGQEEGSKLQQYLEEIEQLKEELEYHKKFDRNSTRSPYTSNEELKRDVVRLEMQNEELLNELNEKEKDLLNEKEEVERYAAQVAGLEREKQELSRELRALQEEAAEKSFKSLKDSPETGAEKHELMEVIRQKNRHISQLLEDMEVIEEENVSLRAKLVAVRDELSDTTTHITEITAELAKLKHLNEELESRNFNSEERIKSLNCQIEELVGEKSKHDQQLDDYILMFNTKLQEWKDEVEAKNDEILKLKEDIKKISSPRVFTSSSSERDLHARIMRQENEIQVLQRELSKATEEINSSTELIEKLKERQLQLVSTPIHTQSIQFYEEKIRVLEEKLIYAEEDAHAKAEEMSDLVIQLREYESGVFGLSEAVFKIKKLEKSVQERDLQIEKLVEICNSLEIKLDEFEEQNRCLRERLGLSASDVIDTSGVKLRYKKDEEQLESLKLRLDQKEEELIKAKLKYRKVVKYLKLHPPPQKSGPDTRACEEIRELSEKLHAILKENDALRKGMHEILESVRNSSGSVEVQSTCLERLLEALDSRHISGWYHPAMRLQAQLSTEEGKNEELRNQIRSLRSEEKKIVSELQNAYLKIQSLENDLSTPREEAVVVVEEVIPKTRQPSSTMADATQTKASEPTPTKVAEPTQTKMAEPIQTKVAEPTQTKVAEPTQTKVAEPTTAQELRIIDLESKLGEMKLELDRKKTDLGRMEKSFGIEKENLLTKLAELESQNNQLKSGNPDLAKISEQTSQIIVLERQVGFLKNSEIAFREANEKLKQEMIEEEEKMLKEILKLQNEKSKLLTTVEKLELDALNSVPKDKFQDLANELARTREKYKCMIGMTLAMGGDTYEGVDPQSEVRLLQDEKRILLEELKVAKEKLIATEVLAREELVTNGDFSNEVSAFASKLAAYEVRELSEKQKSSHLEKINELLKSQQEEVEARNKELLSQIRKLAEENEKLAEAEREVRLKFLSRLSEEEQESLENKVKILQSKCEDLAAERDNIQELLEISQGQCRGYQEWRDRDKIILASLNEQVLLLQATGDDKAKISRLSHELTMAKLATSQLGKKNGDLKMKVTKLLTQTLNLELKAEENRRELLDSKKKHLMLTEYLYKTIEEVRNLYGGAVPFRSAEDVHNVKVRLSEKQKEVAEREKELKNQIHEYSVKKEEMETQLESLEDLKSGLRGDAKNLIAWHNKTTELRLKEAKCRRENDFLIGEISQLENSLKKLNEELSNMEEGNIEKEKEWEEKQVLWEKAQLQLVQLLQEKGVKKKKTCEAATNTETVLEGQTTSQVLNAKMQEMETEIAKLRQEGQKKDEMIMMKDKLLSNGKPKTIELEETVQSERIESAEKEALKMTVQSLQSIIQQKEETIIRYQDLLREGREEYGKSCGKLQEELRSLNETLTEQSKAYNKLKNAVKENQFATEAIPEVVEKYLTKIHELEEELREYETSLEKMNAEASACQQEMEKWKSLAEERLTTMEELRRRLEDEQKNEEVGSKDEVAKYKKEVERLNQFIDLLRKDAVKLEEAPEEKGSAREDIEIYVKSDRHSDCTFDKPQRKEQASREMESLRRQLKFAKDESTRLREQVRLLQSKPAKRPRTTGSSTSRSDKSSLKEESLVSKIKHLEELLTTSKEREKELLEISQKKLKSAEEVARWDEKKKSQQTIQSLTAKLKEREAEVEVLKNKNDSFRNMIYKCEREKVILESQLKSARGGPGGINAKIEKLMMEKQELETEIAALRQKLEEQLRHSGGLGAALLQEKLEEQERKLASFELASMGQGALMEEFDRLKAANMGLEKLNLKLESENLSLQLKLEKEKAESKYLAEKNKHILDRTEEVKRQESDRAISHLQVTIEKLREENKRLKAVHKAPAPDKARKELSKLREDHDLLRLKYVEAVDRNLAMEDELKSCRYQIHLMEEKDLAEALSRTDTFHASTALSEELVEVRAKLAHKTQLLSRVKTLLVKAAAREKALMKQVTVLQSLAPNPDCDLLITATRSYYAPTTGPDGSRREASESMEEVPSEVFVNPECPVRVISTFLRETFRLDSKCDMDLCDVNGNLVFINEKEPWTNASNFLKMKSTYYVVLFSKETDTVSIKPSGQDVSSEEIFWNDIMTKIKRQLKGSKSHKSSLKVRLSALK